MRVSPFWLIIVAVCGILCGVQVPSRSIPVTDLHKLQNELAGQSGTGYMDEMLLDAMSAHDIWSGHRADTAYRRCKTFWANRGPDQALPHCQEAVKRDPGESRYRIRLARVLVDFGDSRAALNLLRDLKPQGPLIDRVFFLWARGWAQMGLQEGILDMSQARMLILNDNPDSEFLAIADYNLGMAFKTSGNVALATEALQRALQRQTGLVPATGNYGEYLFYLGKILYALGQREEADKVKADLLSRDPTRYEYQRLN